MTVSYTHLDVYKRQDNCVLEISDRLRPLVSLIKQEVEGGEAHSSLLYTSRFV